MTVPNTFTSGTLAKSAEVNENFEYFENMKVPIGFVGSWLKTFSSADDGTTDATTTNKLVQSGQNFETTIEIGYVVHNTTDGTFAYVTAVDSDTTLSLDNDIMTSGETYVIYKTPALPENWVECNGQTLNDSDSPYDGETIPDLNGDNKFLYGDSTSGGTKTEDFLPVHKHTLRTVNGSGDRVGDSSGGYSNNSKVINNSSASGTAWEGYAVVYIMRVK